MNKRLDLEVRVEISLFPIKYFDISNMEECTKCHQQLSKVNKGGLCKKCYHNRKKSDNDNSIIEEHDSQINSGSNYETVTDCDLDKAITGLTIRDILAIVHKQILPLEERLKKLEEHFTAVESVKGEVKKLRDGGKRCLES